VSSSRKGRIGVGNLRQNRQRECEEVVRSVSIVEDNPILLEKGDKQANQEDSLPSMGFLDRYELTVSHYIKLTEISLERPPKPEIPIFVPRTRAFRFSDDTFEKAKNDDDNSLQETVASVQNGDFDLADELQDVAFDCFFFFHALKDEASDSIARGTCEG
jgi:hypothetical protein